MNLEMVYRKSFAPKFRTLKMLAIIELIAGCLINMLFVELASFIVGSSVSFLGCLLGFERNIRKHMIEADEAKISNNKLHVSANDSKIKLTIDKDSSFLSWIKLDSGEKVAVINMDVVACKISENNKNPNDSEKLDRI
ncbi:MAG: hypothetical protein ACYSUY_21390 [Planctomycetota bacterium]|jgi:hypothetical protein